MYYYKLRVYCTDTEYITYNNPIIYHYYTIFFK